jgi:uncharacterized protein (TIGR02569 family)
VDESAGLAPPPDEVIAAFGARGEPERLPGGRGLTWRVGETVLRPAGEPEEAVWKSATLASLAEADDFAVPRPIADDRGEWVRAGWEALEWVPGASDPTRVDDVVRAGDAFHRAIAHLDRPAFIDAASDPWSRADRIAWGEAPMPGDPLLRRAGSEFRDVDAAAGLIHGDLLGNVLFAPGRAPVVIDWAPYWRPVGLGAAVAVADAACFHGYPLERLADDRGVPHWRQLLLRALVFRMATLHLLGRWDAGQPGIHEPVLSAVLALPDAPERSR